MEIGVMVLAGMLVDILVEVLVEVLQPYTLCRFILQTRAWFTTPLPSIARHIVSRLALISD